MLPPGDRLAHLGVRPRPARGLLDRAAWRREPTPTSSIPPCADPALLDPVLPRCRSWSFRAWSLRASAATSPPPLGRAGRLASCASWTIPSWTWLSPPYQPPTLARRYPCRNGASRRRPRSGRGDRVVPAQTGSTLWIAPFGADHDVERTALVRPRRHDVADGAVGPALDADGLDGGRRQLLGDRPTAGDRRRRSAPTTRTCCPSAPSSVGPGTSSAPSTNT